MNLRSLMNLPLIAKCRTDGIDGLNETAIKVTIACHDAVNSRSLRVIRTAIAKAETFLATVKSQATALQAAMEPMPAEEIGSALLRLITAWPNAPKADIAGYGAQLVEDVMLAAPCRRAIDEACRSLRRTCKFLPSIAEVLAEITAAQDTMRNLSGRIERLPSTLERLQAAAARIQQIDTEQAERRARRDVPGGSNAA